MDDARRLAGGNYDYKDNNGRDWPDIPNSRGFNNECGKPSSQSPIDLPSGGPQFPASKDNFNKMYYNSNRGEVKWVGDTSKVTMPDNKLDTRATKGKVQFFYSEYGAVIGGPTQYGADQFHFHTGSEHTVGGVRHDMEMHTVHFPQAAKGGVIAAAMGIFFSVNDHTANASPEQVAIIDAFFDSL
jgi:carbonic anhydrase